MPSTKKSKKCRKHCRPLSTHAETEKKVNSRGSNKIESSQQRRGANSFYSVKPSLSQGVLEYVESLSFHTMTPVQAATIPLFLTNKDVAVQAVTGSGKTLAFLIPIVEMILRRTVLLTYRQIGGLIISPTRELARQTYSIAQDLCRMSSISEPLLLVGGNAVSDDLRAFQKQKSDLIIGTPGRIEDVLTRYDVIDVTELECLVLDEADVLLDMGFDLTLTSILGRLPKMRRTGLFSATGTAGGTSGAGSRGIKELMLRAGMRNPVNVAVNVAIATNKAGECGNSESDPSCSLTSAQHQATPTSLSNYYTIAPLDKKLSALVSFLRSHKNEKAIVFFLTCASVEFYGSALQQIMKSYYLELLHGKMVQKRREKAMERFRQCTNSESKNKGGALFCTDVAARGLDVTDVNWVVQFDAPTDPASFVHRVGRSARAGKVGSSLLFLTEKEESYIDFMRRRKVPLQLLPGSYGCEPPTQSMDQSEAKEAKSYGKEDNAKSDETARMVEHGKVAEPAVPDVLPKIKKLVLSDRDILEKGTKAFTSYVRAYKEHHCSFIFRFASLDLGLLATSFCLLRLPKMPELRDKAEKLSFRPAGPEIDIHAIAFKDKVREKARQKRLATELAAGGKNAKQIKAERRQAELLRRQKDRREAERAKGRNPNKKRGRQAQLFDEWDDLAKEERLYKKLRRGKITIEEYEHLMYGGRGDSHVQQDRRDGDAV